MRWFAPHLDSQLIRDRQTVDPAYCRSELPVPAYPTGRIIRWYRPGGFGCYVYHLTMLHLDPNLDLALNPQRPRVLRVIWDGVPARHTVERDSGNH